MGRYDEKMKSLNAYFPHGHSSPGDVDRLLRDFEKIFRPLPPDYREFVAAWGGSAFQQKVAYPITGSAPFGSEGLLDVFYGLLPISVYDLASNARMYAGRLPMDLLPVAQDPGSNQICIGTRGAGAGGVFFWDKESEVHPAAGLTPDAKSAWRIAASWGEFISLLGIWKRPSRG